VVPSSPNGRLFEALTKFAFLTMRRNEHGSERTPNDAADVLSLKNESLTILAA
jgi:hypothetical protein